MNGYLQQNLSDNKVNSEIYFQYLQVTLEEPFKSDLLDKRKVKSTVTPTNPCTNFEEWYKWFHSHFKKS